jgi:hypothetical protein
MFSLSVGQLGLNKEPAFCLDAAVPFPKLFNDGNQSKICGDVLI